MKIAILFLLLAFAGCVADKDTVRLSVTDTHQEGKSDIITSSFNLEIKR